MQGEDKTAKPLRGTPFFLMPFHVFIVYNILGFKIKGTKINRFHECLIFIPRKNVKTSFAAGLSYALAILNRMSGSKIYVVAAALKQTMETFDFLVYNIKNMGEWDEQEGISTSSTIITSIQSREKSEEDLLKSMPWLLTRMPRTLLTATLPLRTRSTPTRPRNSTTSSRRP